MVLSFFCSFFCTFVMRRLDPRDAPSAARFLAWRAATPPWTRAVCALLLCGALVSLVLGGSGASGGASGASGGRSPRYVVCFLLCFMLIFGIFCIFTRYFSSFFCTVRGLLDRGHRGARVWQTAGSRAVSQRSVLATDPSSHCFLCSPTFYSHTHTDGPAVNVIYILIY